MKLSRTVLLRAAALSLLSVSVALAQGVEHGERNDDGRQVFWLSNDSVKCSVFVEAGRLVSDRLEALPEWSSEYATQPVAVETDADFALDLMWTGWRAPGMAGNAENPLILTSDDFRLAAHEVRELPEGGAELDLLFVGIDNPFELRITYQLEEDAFYARRRLAVRDPRFGHHFLRWFWPRSGLVVGEVSVLKAGGFGQPVALLRDEGGAFLGLEYPASENHLGTLEEGGIEIRCGQEIGERIGASWTESAWAVEGLSPDEHVKLWFWKYMDRIRVAPLRPYLLYNSWYDLRAPEMVESPEFVLNEENLLRIIGSFRTELLEERGLTLDAFVLDDGWDVYRSDWVLREEQFPGGLAPVAEALRELGTDLGIWLGPIGGYSHRDWRIEWMRAHGYEVVGDQLCLAGERYRQLFRTRVVEFVRDDDIGYFKWDGIQFSCSEPDHGHPVGIYSRRAVVETVIELCRAVRAENPNLFLNVTSGTWLSPWWVQHANTIWMQGYDYGYADVPSISRRDAAITYRDFVLHDDLIENDFWFPIANLMTHGIIKGHLQQLGGEAEPLDKFTDNAVLYFARGVSMWELYVSPDLLSDGEWDALAESIRWARDRFEVLSSTEMIGGDPGEREAYGYLHFAGDRGIVAARNPFIEPQTLHVALSPAHGLDPEATSLVVERIYPTRWISPRLYEAGSNLEIPLRGYETAIYEIYPLGEATEPLPAGATFEVVRASDSAYVVELYEVEEGARLLNPESVRAVGCGGVTVDPQEFSLPTRHLPAPVGDSSVRLDTGESSSVIDISFVLGEPASGATLAILLEPSGEVGEENEPEVIAFLDGEGAEPRVEQRVGRWAWYLLDVEPGEHTCRIAISPAENRREWRGKVSAWLVCTLEPEGTEVSFELAREPARQRPMPPRPRPAGELRRNYKLGEVEVTAFSDHATSQQQPDDPVI